MKCLPILLLLFAGCGSGVVSPPSQERPEPAGPRPAPQPHPEPLPELEPNPQPQPEPEPVPEPVPEPEPEPTPQFLAGTYVGTVQCLSITTLGFLTTEADSSDIETVTFDLDGHFMQSGDPISVGDTFSRGNDSNVFVVRFVNNSANAFDYGGEVIQSLPMTACNNTCFFAFDFVCDEVQFCNPGTDCADCGPPALTGTFEDIFQAQQNGTVRMLRSVAVFSNDGTFSLSFNCDGILSR